MTNFLHSFLCKINIHDFVDDPEAMRSYRDIVQYFADLSGEYSFDDILDLLELSETHLALLDLNYPFYNKNCCYCGKKKINNKHEKNGIVSFYFMCHQGVENG